jgi:hypothetical protein
LAQDLRAMSRVEFQLAVLVARSCEFEYHSTLVSARSLRPRHAQTTGMRAMSRQGPHQPGIVGCLDSRHTDLPDVPPCRLKRGGVALFRMSHVSQLGEGEGSSRIVRIGASRSRELIRTRASSNGLATWFSSRTRHPIRLPGRSPKIRPRGSETLE